MFLLDYIFVKSYLFYKRNKEGFDHQKLTIAAQNIMTILGGLLAIELTFATHIALGMDITNKTTMLLTLLIFSSYPIWGFIFRYRDEATSTRLLDIYQKITNAEIARIKKRILLFFILLQVFCILIFCLR